MAFRKSLFSIFCLVLSSAAFAGGLDSATSAITDIKTWLYAFVGVAALVYLLYLVVMAFLEKRSWNDVAVGLVYCAIAGGTLVAGDWAINLFK